MFDKKKKPSTDFNQVAKGALAGAGVACAVAALPFISLSVPLVAIGAGIGALVKLGK